MAEISVLGAGSWGTALATLLTENGHQVTLWSHKQSEVDALESTHTLDKLPGIVLPEKLLFTADLESALYEKDLIVFAVPSIATRETALKCKPYLPTGQKIITVSKGIEESTLLTQVEIIEEILPEASVGILSGPSHAEEVILHMPTLVVAAGRTRDLAVFTQEIFMNENFRVYTSPDVTGVEVGGSLKNVIALAAGISDGLGFGDNAKAALITRGVKEMSELAVKMGGEPETLAGLTGIGDLIVTCQSQHSRNRRAGMYIGQGMKMDEAMKKVNMVVEGVYSAKAAKALGEKYQVEMPIVEEINDVLFADKDPKEACLTLMTRDKKKEVLDSSWG